MNDIFDKILEALQGIFNRLGGSQVIGYAIKQRAETITENTRLNENKYGGWLAVNTGTTICKVYGIELQPGEGLSSQSICQLRPGDRWEEPIDIEVIAPGSIRMLRTLATPIR